MGKKPSKPRERDRIIRRDRYTRVGSRIPTVPDPAWDEAIRRYVEAVGAVVSPATERDDLPRVKLAAPAVKPKGVKPAQIRKAVRKAVKTYGDKHAKASARS